MNFKNKDIVDNAGVVDYGAVTSEIEYDDYRTIYNMQLTSTITPDATGFVDAVELQLYPDNLSVDMAALLALQNKKVPNAKNLLLVGGIGAGVVTSLVVALVIKNKVNKLRFKV